MKLSIVTPSYNQGHYLEDTVLSVLSQPVSDLEYMVLDGGSTDDSKAIIQAYSDRIAYWRSEQDSGQAAAINEGFQRSNGDVLGWLNSDDVFTPTALKEVCAAFSGISSPTLVFGDAITYLEDAPVAYKSDVVTRYSENDIRLRDYVVQPSSFMNRKAWELVGPLDERLTYTFDWDWFIRARQCGVEFKPVSSLWSLYRVHDGHKTGSGSVRRDEEIANIYRLYASESCAEAFKKISGDRGRFEKMRYRFGKLRLRKILGWHRFSALCLHRGVTEAELRQIEIMADF